MFFTVITFITIKLSFYTNVFKTGFNYSNHLFTIMIIYAFSLTRNKKDIIDVSVDKMRVLGSRESEKQHFGGKLC
jgi:hypothetical protein